MQVDYSYEALPSGEPYDWGGTWRGDHPDDNVDFHVDLGAGRSPKGRLTIDRYGPVDLPMELDTPNIKFPFEENSIESMISHHCLEHIGYWFLPLMDECYRVLKPGALFRIIVPMFPSLNSIDDPDHKRYFTRNTFQSFVGQKQGPFWSDAFAEPYTKCRFSEIEVNASDPQNFGITETNQFMVIGGAESGELIGSISIDDLFKEPRELRVSLIK